LSTEMAVLAAQSISKPVARSRRKTARDSTSGSSGTVSIVQPGGR